MRRPLTAIAASLALTAVLTLPAAADTTGDTTTFTISAGGLAITVPASSNLGSVASGAGSVSGRLGSITVTDTRAALVAAWITTVGSTAFTTGAATTAETVPAANVSYSGGAATSTSGLGVFLPGVAGTLGSSRTAFTLTAGTGNNSSTWNPTITVTLPSAVVAGTYTGTVPHSVA